MLGSVSFGQDNLPVDGVILDVAKIKPEPRARKITIYVERCDAVDGVHCPHTAVVVKCQVEMQTSPGKAENRNSLVIALAPDGSGHYSWPPRYRHGRIAGSASILFHRARC